MQSSGGAKPAGTYRQNASILDELRTDLAVPSYTVPVVQEAFDENYDALRRIAAWCPGDAALSQGVLAEYCLDIRWTAPLQPTLLAKVLYAAAECWRDALAGHGGTEFIEDLFKSLYGRPNIIADTIGYAAEQSFARALQDLLVFHMSQVARLDESSDDWIPYYGALGYVFDGIARFHSALTTMCLSGLAICFVAWCSIVSLHNEENPVFIGRRPLVPWYLFAGDMSWRSDNLLEMERFLDPAELVTHLETASSLIEETDRWIVTEISRRISEKSPSFLSRAADVIRNLRGADGYWSHECGMQQ